MPHPLRLLTALLAPLLIAAQSATARPVPLAVDKPVEVMVLGSFHMANPGQDLHNPRIDPVTTPKRQRELKAIADALARFRPTVIAVESVASDQGTLIDQGYARFTPADLSTTAGERTQIAYRLAHDLGLRQVYAIDEQPLAGETDYFPFDAVQRFAQANGREAVLAKLMDEGAAATAELEALQARASIGAMLAHLNDPARIAREQRDAYYGLMPLGQGRDLPGAVLNARWYERNAKIFAKLTQVAKPGDRVLLLFGAGHNYWLRHFASTADGYRIVDPLPYLESAR